MKYRTVQTMMLPDCAEENYGLYYQGTEGIQVQRGEKKSLSVPENEKADLFTYFNGFYPKQWSQYAHLDGLRIKVTVSGNCRVLLCHTDGSRTVVDEEKESRTASDTKNELVFEVSDTVENVSAFWICVEGLAQGGVLYGVDFQSAVEVQQTVQPAVVICTCRREKEVIGNLERISRMNLEERPGIFLIDNGNTLTEEMVPDWVHLVPNKNCGGAGGFTRGMIEALKDPEFTHVILMDDDIVLNPEVLTKTVLFLSSVKKEWKDAPLGGSLIERDIPWKQFECGAFWNRGRIQGCGQNMDLRKRDALLKNTESQNWDYGGWWYCCIPVSAIREKGLPLPVFIHRDDIEYGIRMGKLMTLNGIGVWHEAVTKKLPQIGEYYDIRNMAILNAIHYDDWDKRQWKKFLVKWTAGNLLRGRYDYIYLNICAMLDFLKGEKWLENTDGVEIHKQVAGRLPKLEKLDKKEKNVFYTTPNVNVYTVAKKKHIVYEDSAGFCLRADKNLPETIRLSIYLLLALRKTDRYFERARESYGRNWKKLITEEFWNNYLEINKDE